MLVNPIAIVTDSTADIPVQMVEEYQIRVVPNVLIIDGQNLVDGQDISREEFYQRLPRMKTPPTTATASQGVYQETYEALLQQGASQILSIHASSLLSGIINAATTAASFFEGRIHVIDSQQVTLGLGFQVLAAAEAVKNRTPVEAVLKLLERVRQRVRVMAMLDTLEYVRRSGRVSWTRARLGELLNIKPFVEVRNGRVISLGETRTRRKGIVYLTNLYRRMGLLERLAILHTNAEVEARQFLDSIDPNHAIAALIVNITTIIGAHVGPNGLGFAAVIKG